MADLPDYIERDAAAEGLVRRLRRTAADLGTIGWGSDRKNVADAIDMLTRRNAGVRRPAAIAQHIRESTKSPEERAAAFDAAIYAPLSPPSRLTCFLLGGTICGLLAVLVQAH